MNNFILPEWKRAVLKVGSSQVAPDGKGVSSQYALAIANFIIQSHKAKKEIVLVSSGAVAAGLSTQQKLQQKTTRPIPEKQALAAIGQSLLMQHWSRFFDFPCAQILLTREGLHNRESYVNAKNTVNELLKLNALPIVNENDTVATEELKVGDNDNLAAHVAVMVEADILIICTDTEGLFDGDPNKNKNSKLIHAVEKIDENIYTLAGDSSNPIATGGMKTKIEAAEKATSRGIDTLIINGKNSKSFDALLKGEFTGTIFNKQNTPVAAKKHWLLHTLKSTGRIFIDAGARNALLVNGASLLPSGIINVEGNFKTGDAIEIMFSNESGNEKIAKGITQYNSVELAKIKGKKSSQISEIIGYYNDDEVIHRDDLVLIQNL